MITTLLNLVIYIVVLGLILWLIQYLIVNIPMPEPFRRIANIILVVVGILLLIGLLLGLVGENPRLPRFGGLAARVVAACHLAVPNFLAKAVALAGLQMTPSFGKIVVVEAVSLARAEAVLDDGSVWPIVDWFDDEGDHCGRYDDPVVAVIGNDRTGFAVVDLSDFAFDTVLQ